MYKCIYRITAVMKVETDSITNTVKHVPVYKGQSKMQGDQKTCPL